MHDSRLVDATTNLSTAGFVRGASIFGISAVEQSQPFNQILVDYPEITRVTQTPEALVRDVHHHIHTKGPAISERARRVSPDKFFSESARENGILQAGPGNGLPPNTDRTGGHPENCCNHTVRFIRIHRNDIRPSQRWEIVPKVHIPRAGRSRLCVSVHR